MSDIDTKAIEEQVAEQNKNFRTQPDYAAYHDDNRTLLAALLSALKEKDAEIVRLRGVLSAARNIRHWHDAMKDNSGMVVSAEHVRQLWASISAYDAALTTQEPKS